MKKIRLFFIMLFSSVTFANAPPSDDYLLGYFSSKAKPLITTSSLNEMIELMGDRQLVMLGESSHGSAEFYAKRLEITKRLIREKKFNFIVVEGDWASIARLNQYVKNTSNSLSSAREVLHTFNRWPEWMWKNSYIENLAEWLRKYNFNLPDHEKVGIYGMDVYEQQDAIDGLLVFIDQYFPYYYTQVNQNLKCFTRRYRQYWEQNIARGDFSCQQGLTAVANLLHYLVATNNTFKEIDFFQAEQNALIVKNAESFYRLSDLDKNTDSWNSRADHMWLSIKRLLALHGDQSKGIIWAHNTHVGDARATPMYSSGLNNIGHLSRAEFGERRVFILGFGTNQGKVSAAHSWGEPMQVMTVPIGADGSYEQILSQINKPSFYLLFNNRDRANLLLNQYRQHRAIGVVYDPDHEKSKHYVPSILPRRYDGFIFINNTTELKELD
ncbi:MAG: erythromycin esterase family protein [Candidatus Thioglobus sp.]|nr:erythromycin esterase family protein [Candidatus Thioglobus sp.]